MAERVSWLVLGVVIHLPPFAAFFVPSLIVRLYSVPPDDPNFALLQHRAALFGVVVVACLWAAFDPSVRKIAFVMTALSMTSFLILYLLYGQPEALTAIAVVDLVGLPCLLYVGWKAFAISGVRPPFLSRVAGSSTIDTASEDAKQPRPDID